MQEDIAAWRPWRRPSQHPPAALERVGRPKEEVTYEVVRSVLDDALALPMVVDGMNVPCMGSDDVDVERSHEGGRGRHPLTVSRRPEVGIPATEDEEGGTPKLVRRLSLLQKAAAAEKAAVVEKKNAKEAKVMAKKEKAEQKRVAERIYAEKVAEARKVSAEKAAAEQIAADKAAAEKAAAEKAAAEKTAAEKAAAEKAAAEKAAAEKASADKSAAEKAAADKAAAEIAAAEKAASISRGLALKLAADKSAAAIEKAERFSMETPMDGMKVPGMGLDDAAVERTHEGARAAPEKKVPRPPSLLVAMPIPSPAENTIQAKECFEAPTAREMFPTKVIGRIPLDSRVYVCKFTNVAMDLIVATSSGAIRVYSTEDVITSLGAARPLRVILGNGSSVLDVDVSSDDRLLCYCGWGDGIGVVPLYNNPFASPTRLGTGAASMTFCARFSGDARHVLTGNADNAVMVIDVERDAIVSQMTGHAADTNAVCYLEPKASSVFVSGGDDALIKVWDGRVRPRAVGVLPGHMDGICFLEARNDGRHVMSTSKDQTIKVWDTRRLAPVSREAELRRYVSMWQPQWNYQGGDEVPKEQFRALRHSSDQSVVTYGGAHTLQRTLIRAKFGSGVVVTGSVDGAVVAYDGVTGGVLHRVSCHTAVNRDFAYCPSFGVLCSGGFDASVAILAPDGRTRLKRRMTL